MILRPVRFVAVFVLTTTFVLTGCTTGGTASDGGASRTADHAMGELDDLPSTWVWK